MLVGRSVNNIGRNPDDGIGSHMHFHAEMPRVPFLAACHLRGALAAAVLRGARRLDEARINNSALAEP